MDEPGERWALELLLREAETFYREARFASALDAVEKARDGAKRLADLGLEVRAARFEATLLHLLGRNSEALTRYSWLLTLPEDPANRSLVSEESCAFEIVSAFDFWTSTALFLPEIQVGKLFEVLDAGERFVRSLGRPTWRAGLLSTRAKVLRHLDRLDEAIVAAEEGLALRLRDSGAPGATLASHRWGLADLLVRGSRTDHARALYQAVLDDRHSEAYDRFIALRGLCRCALEVNEPSKARRFADDAVGLAESMGDDALSGALGNLTDACLAQDDRIAAQAASERQLRVARAHGGTIHLFAAFMSAAKLALTERNLSRARALLDEALPCAAALDSARNGDHYRAMLDRLDGQRANLEITSREPR